MQRLTAHVRGNAVGYLALFVALGGTSYAATQITGRQIANGTIASVDIRDGTISSRDIQKGSLRSSLFAADARPKATRGPAGPAGPQGPKGASGDQGAIGPAGPIFGESKAIPNKSDISCNVENVVGEQTINLTKQSRILAFANGTLRDGGATTTTYGMWLRLRNAADSQTLAITSAAWDFDDGATVADTVMPLSVTSVMATGTSPEISGAPFVAQPGTYRLQLIASATELAVPCATNFPDFGYNQGSGMGYVVLGNG